MCPQIPKWMYKYIGIGHYPTSKIAWIGRENMENYQYM